MLLAVAGMLSAQSAILPFSRIDLLFAGDLMQHQSQLDASRCANGTYSFSSCYKYISNDVRSADIAVANLETTIGAKGFGGYPAFCAPDSFLYAVKDAGFDVMLFANNHCLDRGKGGALRTMHMMDSLGIVYCGVYRDSTERADKYPLMLERNNIRIALLNYTYGTNGIPVPPPLIVNFIDKAVIAADIARAKELCADVIIACMHWGNEYVSLPPAEVRSLASWLLQQGVDHIIGGHPHVLQPIEVRSDSATLRRSAVVYSLGNLISGMYARGRDGGAMAHLDIYKCGYLTQLQEVRYSLTWVARPERDGVDNFTILPAATPPFPLKSVTSNKITEFVYDSRKLFERYNSDRVVEYMIE